MVCESCATHQLKHVVAGSLWNLAKLGALLSDVQSNIEQALTSYFTLQVYLTFPGELRHDELHCEVFHF